MHFQGQPLISQATHVSSRTLVTVSLAKIFAIWFGVNTADLEVLGLKLGEAFVTIAPLLIGFFALNHLLSWLGDLHAFQAWNSPQKIGGSSRFGPGGSPLRSALDDVVARLEGLEKTAESTNVELEKTGVGESLPRDVGEIARSSKHIANSLESLKRSTERLNRHARLYLWGWFLLMPMGLAAYATWLAVCAR